MRDRCRATITWTPSWLNEPPLKHERHRKGPVAYQWRGPLGAPAARLGRERLRKRPAATAAPDWRPRTTRLVGDKASPPLWVRGVFAARSQAAVAAAASKSAQFRRTIMRPATGPPDASPGRRRSISGLWGAALVASNPNLNQAYVRWPVESSASGARSSRVGRPGGPGCAIERAAGELPIHPCVLLIVIDVGPASVRPPRAAPSAGGLPRALPFPPLCCWHINGTAAGCKLAQQSFTAPAPEPAKPAPARPNLRSAGLIRPARQQLVPMEPKAAYTHTRSHIVPLGR